MTEAPEIFPAEKACSKCHRLLPSTVEHFPADGRKADGLRRNCRACGRDKAKAWAEANRERSRENSVKYRLFNGRPDAKRQGYKVHDREAEKRKHRDYLKRKPELAASKTLRNRLAQLIKSGGVRHSALLGCSSATLKVHLESQFAPGMTWENRRLWHIDHIRPLASFDLTDPEQRAQAAHYTNLQPLWAADNLRKGAKILS